MRNTNPIGTLFKFNFFRAVIMEEILQLLKSLSEEIVPAFLKYEVESYNNDRTNDI